MSRDIAEPISTLAQMARFVIADITEAKSIPADIVPYLTSVPVQPLILRSDYEYGLSEHIQKVSLGSRDIQCDNQVDLLNTLDEKVIGPASGKANEIRRRNK